MKGEFVIRIGQDLITYDNFDDIPAKFDNLIRFVPDFPPGPHTQEQHDEIDNYPEKLFELLKRETNMETNV